LPSTKNSTLSTPTLSAAVAVRSTTWDTVATIQIPGDAPISVDWLD